MKKLIGGIFMVIMGLAGIGAGLRKDDPSRLTDFLLGPAFLLIGLLLIASSQGYSLARLVRLATGAERRDRQTALQRRVITAAAAHGGLITVSQLVLKTGLSIDEAEAILTSLSARGLCVMDLDDEAVVRYRFPELR